MVVYALIELESTNLEAMGPYVDAVPATIAAHGGRYLVMAGNTEVVEGGLGEFPVKVVLEFPFKAAAISWYNSAEYQEIHPIRMANSRGNFVWVEGV